MPWAPQSRAAIERTKARRVASEQRRGSAQERGYTARWQRASRAFLEENPLCRACETAGRLVAATLTDHIIPHRGDMDLFWDQGNWQPLCKPCHDSKTAREDGGFGVSVATNPIIHLICGPPGCGKTTYAKAHAKAGDLIVDYDAIMQAISGLPEHDRPESLHWFAYDAIEALYRRLQSSHVTAWVVCGYTERAKADALASKLKAEIVILDNKPAVCRSRVASRPDHARFEKAINEWLVGWQTI